MNNKQFLKMMQDSLCVANKKNDARIAKYLNNGTIAEALLEDYLNYCRDEGLDLDIFIIPPLGKFKKYKEPIVVFPMSFQFKDKAGRTRLGVIRHTVLYKNELHDHREFFKDKELVDTEKMLSRVKANYILKIPFYLACMSHENFLFIKRTALTPLRKYFYQLGIINDYRGKSKGKSEAKKSRNKFIVDEYGRLGKPKRFPIKKIQEAWMREIDKLFSKGEKNYYCSDNTMRRVLKSFHKK